MKRSIQQLQLENLCSDMVKAFTGVDVIPESVDIDSFVKEYLGYSIIYETFADRNKLGFTSDGITPLTVIRNGEKKIIVFPSRTIVIDKFYLNEKQNQKRRFIIAHEAGHILYGLAEGGKASGYCTDSSDGYTNSSFVDICESMSVLETKANKYAAALLMPDYIVGNLIRKYHDGKKFSVYNKVQFAPADRKVVEKMAVILDVSYSALFYRLRDLGALINRTDKSYLSELNIGGNNSGNN